MTFGIDATGLNVYGEGEWKVKKHGTDGKRKVWQKQYAMTKALNNLTGLGMPETCHID